MNKPRQLFLSESGSMLIEAMIGAAIVTVAAMALMSVAQFVATGSRNVAIPRMERVAIEHLVADLMASETTCRLALGGPTTQGGTVVPAIAQTASATVPTNIQRLYQPVAIAGAGRPVLINTAVPTRIGTWEIDQIVLTPYVGTAPNTTQGRLSLRFKHVRANQGSANSPEFSTQTINISYVLDGANRIASCFGMTYGALTTGTAPTTVNSNDYLVPGCGPDQAIYSNGVHSHCRTIDCASGTPNGWDAGGNVICL